MPEEPVRIAAEVTPGPQRPKWSEQATEAHAKHVDNYDGNLKLFSERFADFHSVEHVVVNHVTEAHSALARSGLSSIHNFWRRPENVTAAGGACIGLSFAVNDVFSLFMADTTLRTSVSVGVFI